MLLMLWCRPRPGTTLYLTTLQSADRIHRLIALPCVLLEELVVDVVTHVDNPVILQEPAPLQELELFQDWAVELLLEAVVDSLEVSHPVEDLLVLEDLQSHATSVDRETTVLGIVWHRELSVTPAERVRDPP